MLELTKDNFDEEVTNCGGVVFVEKNFHGGIHSS